MPRIRRTKEFCRYCGRELKEYYHDAGDHFGAGSSPYSEWRLKECECLREKSDGRG